jgi:KDO2-lipid IV(A) lauroyltransferase
MNSLSKQTRYLLQGLMFGTAYRVFGSLPVEPASALGAALGRRFGPLLARTHIARANLARAFPELNAAEIDRIMIAMWDNLGRVLAEFPHVGKMNKEQFLRLVTVEGAEHVEEIKRIGAGGIFFSGHFANWELAPKTLAMLDCPLALVYRPGNNPYLDRVIQNTRGHYQTEAVPKGAEGSRLLMRALRDKRHIGMLIDQKMNTGIPVRFLGREAMTATAIASLALKFDCPVIPTRVVRLEGPYHKVTILPPLEIRRTGDQDADIRALMESINALFEEWIRAAPPQWIWVHRRWPATGRQHGLLN